MPTPPGYGCADVADYLHLTIGPAIADLVVAVAERSLSRNYPAPAAVMAVRPFEPHQGDEVVLFHSARAVMRQRRVAPERRQIG